MTDLSQTEENYLKAIFKICEKSGKSANTNAIAAQMETSAASVTDMLQRLAGKGLIHYEKYRGVTLTPDGSQIATNLVRKHRLWEVFLVEKLQFSWSEVHEIAEQLEHIKSEELVEQLDRFLGFPKFDPHGDPIPDADGNFARRKQRPLSELSPGEAGVVVGVQDHTAAFLDFLDQLGIGLGTQIEVEVCFPYDESMRVKIKGNPMVLSHKVSHNLFVQKS